MAIQRNPHTDYSSGMKFREPETGIGSAKQTLLPSGGGSSGGGWGGLLGGFASAYAAKKQAQIARENREWQEKQNKLAYERSLPWNVSGPSGTVEYDEETKQIMSTLAPEYQDLMDQWLGTSGMATTELQGMMGDPYAMEQQQFKRFEDLNRDAYARSRAQGEEAALARGMTGTESYYDKLAIEDAINQSRLGGQMQSMRTGMDYRNMLTAESQGFGQNAMNVAGMLNTQADLGSMVGSRTKPGMNMAGLSLAGTNYADTRSGFWSGMQDQAALYNKQGDMTQAGQKGWLSQLLGGGKQFYSSLV
jgi:hypothetical protein